MKLPEANNRKSTYTFLILLIMTLVVIVLGIEIMRHFNKYQADQTTAANMMPGKPSASYPRELRDGSGEIFTIKSPPQRIVSETLGTDEILLAICPTDRIIGLSSLALNESYSNVAEQARTTAAEIVHEPEQILRLEPDLIFVASYSRAEVVELLKTAQAPVFRFSNFDRIEDIKSNIRTLGYVIGEDARAEALIAQMDREIKAVQARIPTNSRRFRVMSYGIQGYTTGANTTFDDIVNKVGAINVSAQQGIKGFQKISTEQIATWQPDFIVTGAENGKAEEVRRRLLADPAIASSQAGRAGRIIVIDNRYFLTVSHHVVRSIETLAEGLYSNKLEATK
ncbi:MAG: ABC transporter substrate-binding protein [Acidobacteriota bacterium]